MKTKHAICIDTKARNPRDPQKVESRFECACGARGEYVTPEEAHAQGDLHLAYGRLTGPQRELLDSLRRRPLGDYISGGQVTAARALEKLGLVTVTDDGNMVIGGRVDGERWSADITEKGKATR